MLPQRPSNGQVPQRIYLVGAHATGKTTLARWIRDRYHVPMIAEVARGVLAEMEARLETLRTDVDLVDRYQRQVFERQIEAASRLRHPNILSAIDAGTVDGHRYIVSEHVGGRRLSLELSEGDPLPVDRALTTPDGVVVAGRVVQPEFPDDTLVDFGDHWSSLREPEQGGLAQLDLRQLAGQSA